MENENAEHPAWKINKAWEMRMERYSAKHISRAIDVPVRTINAWFYFKSRIMLNRLAAAKVGWRSRKLRNAQKHCD